MSQRLSHEDKFLTGPGRAGPSRAGLARPANYCTVATLGLLWARPGPAGSGRARPGPAPARGPNLGNQNQVSKNANSCFAFFGSRFAFFGTRVYFMLCALCPHVGPYQQEAPKTRTGLKKTWSKPKNANSRFRASSYMVLRPQSSSHMLVSMIKHLTPPII